MTPIIRLANGGWFHLTEPHRSQFTIHELGHALGNLCRYTGHVPFYSVAQHSVYTSMLVRPERMYAALMHDIAEAILGDVSAPLKSLLPDYQRIERQVEDYLFDYFGVIDPRHPDIKAADIKMLATEVLQLGVDTSPIPGFEHEWTIIRDVEPAVIALTHWTPDVAAANFVRRFHILRHQAMREATPTNVVPLAR